MKKIILILPLVMVAYDAHATSAILKCECPDGSSVTTGQYCPGSTTPCGGGGITITKKCPSDCPSETTWTRNSSGHFYAKCDLSDTMGSCTYQCMSGYWGNLSSFAIGLQSCEPCPGNGKSTRGDNTKITDCYITSGSDETGIYVYEPKCNYSE